jgi:hypothetical protein
MRDLPSEHETLRQNFETLKREQAKLRSDFETHKQDFNHVLKALAAKGARVFVQPVQTLANTDNVKVESTKAHEPEEATEDLPNCKQEEFETEGAFWEYKKTKPAFWETGVQGSGSHKVPKKTTKEKHLQAMMVQFNKFPTKQHRNFWGKGWRKACNKLSKADVHPVCFKEARAAFVNAGKKAEKELANDDRTSAIKVCRVKDYFHTAFKRMKALAQERPGRKIDPTIIIQGVNEQAMACGEDTWPRILVLLESAFIDARRLPNVPEYELLSAKRKAAALKPKQQEPGAPHPPTNQQTAKKQKRSKKVKK